MSALWMAFYSVRGGVGRSTTLVLSALELARRGHRVAVVDFDLESPGLDILLAPGEAQEKDRAQEGVVDFLDARARGEPFEVERIIVPLALPGDFAGRLFLVPAGRCDDPYLAALDRIDLKRLYERSGLLNPVRALRAELEEVLEPDVVLVDSRTGYSDTALVTLFDLADVAVVVLVPDLQNVERLAPVLRRLAQAPRSLSGRPQQILLVANKCQLTTPALRALADIEERLRGIIPSGDEQEDEEERPFLHKIPFESAFTWAQRLLPPPAASDARRALGERLHAMLEERTGAASPPVARVMPPAPGIDSMRREVLEHLAFGKDKAEKDPGLLDTFQVTSKVKESLRPERWLIRGGKGTGKSAIFRMLAERPETAVKYCDELGEWRVVTTHQNPWPANAPPGRNYLRPEDFRDAEELFETGDRGWKEFWGACALVQAAEVLPERIHDVDWAGFPGIAEQLAPNGWRTWRARAVLKSAGVRNTLRELISALKALVGDEGPGLLFVYDDLDTGFGTEAQDLARRDKAVSGLLEAWTEITESSRTRLLPKILIRGDLFSSLSLTNANRWRARDVELRWEFSEVAALLAARASSDEKVREWLKKHEAELEQVPPEARSFAVLFDERARLQRRQVPTWRLASSRLADAAGHLAPQDFIRLGTEALELEKASPAAPRFFSPALIAGPHTLVAVSRVSDRRAGDLKLELPDHSLLLESLRGMKSPFREEDLVARFVSAQPQDTTTAEKETLAREVIARLRGHGVIGDGQDGRLFVSDIYLHGLGMSRSGA